MLAFSATSGTGFFASRILANQLSRGPRRARVLALVLAAGAVLIVLRPLALHHAAAHAGGSADETMSCPLHTGGAR
jgi:hypothetical protein